MKLEGMACKIYCAILHNIAEIKYSQSKCVPLWALMNYLTVMLNSIREDKQTETVPAETLQHHSQHCVVNPATEAFGEKQLGEEMGKW